MLAFLQGCFIIVVDLLRQKGLEPIIMSLSCVGSASYQ